LSEYGWHTTALPAADAFCIKTGDKIAFPQQDRAFYDNIAREARPELQKAAVLVTAASDDDAII